MLSLLDMLDNFVADSQNPGKIGILDIGAMLIDGSPAEYRVLLERGYAKVTGFEPVLEECQRLNSLNQSADTHFLPYFIGDGTRQKFYHTTSPMTGSLYEPNTQLLNMFQNLGELVGIVSEEMVDTRRLDDIEELNFPVDYIKIDVQGAELQALNGARNRVLKDVLVIQTEAEWLPLYKNQPLFSELEMFLRSQGFVVHRTMGFGTRAFKPIIMNGNINLGLQHLWSDVIFVRDFTRLDRLKPHQLLKMAIILHEVYHSFDLALILLQEYDRHAKSGLAQAYLGRITSITSEQEATAKTTPTDSPKNFVAFYTSGVEAYQKENFTAALNYFEQAKSVKSDFPPLWHNLGLTQARLGKFQDAMASLDKALILDPSYNDASDLKKLIATFKKTQQPLKPSNPTNGSDKSHKLLKAIELQQENRIAEAEKAFLEILAENPNSVPALFSLGGIEHSRRNLSGAITYFERAIAIKPDFPPLWFNYGTTLQAQKQLDRALASYDRALELDPSYIEALMNRGTVLVDMKRHKDALLNYEDLLKLDPDNDKALCNRGIILTDFKMNDLAIQTFERLLAISPDYQYAAGLLCFAKLHACDWKNLEALRQHIIDGVRAKKRVCKSMAFTAIAHEPNDHLLCASVFAEHFCPPHQPLWQGEKYHHAKIKIAYVSPDFREHPVGHLIAGVFEQHDQNRFETIAVSLGIDDSSQLRQRMMAAFDEFIDVRQMTSYDIAKMLRKKEVDILIDLAGFTADSRPDLFAWRPAPVQINYLGYSSTMGTSYHDYIIADRHIIPEEYRNCYSEKIVYLPDTYLPTDSTLQIAATTPPRHEYGLPDKGFVFCSFNHDYKINPPVFDIWMRLLKQVPNSVLWLMKLNESAEKNLLNEAAERGIEPSRIIFATRVPHIEDHLARYRMADLFLDTFPCNAHSTASDVLRAGLPIVTCRGKAFAGRVASGLLETTGMPELITTTLADYEQLALKLATDKKALDKIRKKLKKNLKNTPLYDTSLYCHNLETAFTAMWKRCQQGLAPDHIVVADNADNFRKAGKKSGKHRAEKQNESFWQINISDGVKVCVQPNIAQMTSYILLEQEDWMEDEIAFVRQFVTPEMNVFDIGANHGVYALSIATKLDSGHVWAFEPTVAPGRMLAKSIELNGFPKKVTWVHAGLSNHNGTAEIATSLNSELNSLHAAHACREKISLTTIDEYIKSNSINQPVNFVKLDAEGEEINILRGGQNFFSRQSPLIMFELKHGSTVNHGLIQALNELGYDIYRLLVDLNILVEYDNSSQSDILNLFACKPDTAAEMSLRGLLARKQDVAKVETHKYFSENDWQTIIKYYPYGMKCAQQWLSVLSDVPDDYLTALSAIIKVHDKTLPAAARVSLLHTAETLLDKFIENPEGAHYSLWLLKIHLLHLQNRRLDSVNLCRQVLSAYKTAPLPGWPFIPPRQSLFCEETVDEVGKWVIDRLAEFVECRQSYSSYFVADPIAGLQNIINNENHSIAIERRLFLASRKAGRFSIADSVITLLRSQTGPNQHIWNQILQKSSV